MPRGRTSEVVGRQRAVPTPHPSGHTRQGRMGEASATDEDTGRHVRMVSEVWTGRFVARRL
ncbi:MAG: hypothetical protein ABR606_13645 [Vicinamibacterales bacterium]